MKRLIPYCCLLGLFFVTSVSAQDSIAHFNIQKVEVISLKEKNTIGLSIQKLDSNTLENFQNTTLANALEQVSNVFIKNYGPGNLASSSLRGGTAQQTAVFWNGFNIKSPMLGQVDFSYFPVGLVDEVGVQYGAGGAVLGGNTQAGAILLKNKAKFKKEVNLGINTSYGSFSSLSNALHFSKGSAKNYTSIKLYQNKEENNFPFLNNTKFISETEKQTNADVNQVGVFAETYFKIKKYQELNIRFWTQETERGTGKPMTKLVEKSRLKNNFYRFSTEYKSIGKHSDWFVRGAFFKENLTFSDSISAIYSNSEFNTFIFEIENERKLNDKFKAHYGVLNTNTSVISENYNTTKTRNATAFYASLVYKSKNEKLNSSLAFRQELVKNFSIPFVPTLGFEYKLNKKFSLKSNGSRNYRIPTFNDLYYQPNGNLNILPENGWSGEIGGVLKLKNIESELTFFANSYDNMIVWQPENGVWKPTNNNVKAQGIENRTTAKGKLKKIKWKLTNNVTFKKSIDLLTEKQLIYNPNWTNNTNVSFSMKDVTLSYTHLFVGERFTSTDNRDYLPFYTIENTQISYKIQKQKFKGIVSFQINNIWNTTYTSIENYPMPLRNYNINLNINLKYKKNEQKLH